MKQLSFNKLKQLVRESILEDNEIEVPGTETDTTEAPAPEGDETAPVVDPAVVDLVKQLAAAVGLTIADAEEPAPETGDAEEPAEEPVPVSERRLRRIREARRRMRMARIRRIAEARRRARK